jgi:hypothetical protein
MNEGSSARAGRLLKDVGITAAKALRGGLDAWHAAGSRFVATVMHGLAVQAASRAGRKDLLRVTDMSPDMASGLVSWGVEWELINSLRLTPTMRMVCHETIGTSRAVSPMSRALSKRCRSILFSIGKSSL